MQPARWLILTQQWMKLCETAAETQSDADRFNARLQGNGTGPAGLEIAQIAMPIREIAHGSAVVVCCDDWWEGQGQVMPH